MKVLTENQLRYLVRSKLRIIVEKSEAGSQPEEGYRPATRKNMFLDRPMSIGGWPEGEYDPPVQDRLVSWFKDMGLMKESVVAYHGTGSSFFEFDLSKTREFGFHFGLTKSQAERRTALNEQVTILKSKINFERPLSMPDVFRWSFYAISPYVDIDHQEKRRLKEEAISNAKSKGTPLGMEMNFATAKMLNAAGYDAIVYENAGEGGGQAVIVWNPSQITVLEKETL